MFSFLRKKSLVKRAALTGAVLVLLTGFLFVSCPNPAGSTSPVNAMQPSISVRLQGDEWDVASEDTFDLTVTASVTDGGQLSYQWHSNSTNSNAGGTPISSNGATLRLAKANYTENKDYYFYVVVTNTISDNGDGGIKTAAATSDVATVTVDGVSGVHLNAQKPVIETQPANTFWNVYTAKDGVKLTVNAAVEDGGTLSYQWYSNTSAGAVNGTKIDTATGKDYTLTKTAYTANGAYYFYVIVTNTNNDVTGMKTVSAASDAAVVTVAGYPDTGYSDTHTLPSRLTGEWESEYGEIYTISAGEFSSGMDWGEGWSGYKGTIVNHRGNANGTAGYITIKYTECTWDVGAENKYYVIYYKGLTETAVTIAGAGSFTFIDPDFGLSGGRASKDEAEATYTVSAGYFAMGSDLIKGATVAWELNDGEWETGSLHPARILSGTALAKPSPNPIKDWYDFGGWYSDAGLTTPYNFSANVTTPLHLYAKWEPAFWTITWHLNGGSWGESQTPVLRVDKDSKVSKPSPDPSKADNIFAGWYSDETLTTQYNFSSNVTAPLNLYAKWNPNQEVILNNIKADLTALSGGGTAAAPADYKVPAALNLDDNNWEGWLGLLQAVWDGGKKYLNLDLSDCAMTGTAFDPRPSIRGGGVSSGTDHPKGRIVSIILPNAAKSITSSTGASTAFNFFINLKTVSGDEIVTVNQNAFNGCRAALTTVNLPKAQTIGANAFDTCTLLATLNLPSVKSFGNSVFQGSSSTSGTAAHTPLTITLGAEPPTVGTGSFILAGHASNKKAVTVRVPSSALETYGISLFSDSDTASDNWGNAFKGKGWDGTSYLSGTVVGTIALSITTY